MDIVTIDLETYYDKDFSLSKMTTEAYIRDPRFQVIGVGIKVNDQEVDTYSGSDVGKFLKSLDYSKRAILCHNTAFDGAVLSWLYDIRPRLWLDTLSMARPAFRTTVGGSLKALASHFNLGAKGTEVINALGKRREDFTEEEMARYMDYCANDVVLTYMLFNKLKVGFPPSELRVIDQTIRMYTEPKIVLDKNQLRQHLSSVRDNKQKLVDALGTVGDQEDIRKVLMSNAKFAELLSNMGVVPPTKTSARTGKEAYAFAKTDKGMTDLLDHPDPLVASLVSARMGIKSTIEETRTEALLAVADRGPLPIMLNYYGAHTGRFSGGDGLNLQNLPARKGKSIRRAIAAPEGYAILGCDLSQIEARMLAWVAGQEDLVESFAKGRDVYCEFASQVYGREITPEDKTERFVGKTCILGLGYQCGAVKFREMLRQAGVEIDEYEAQRIVYTYRNRYPQIVALWNKLGSGLSNILHGGELSVEPLLIQEGGILLPNKLQIKYPALRASQNKYEYLSEQRAYRAFNKGEEIADNKWVNIYGGKVTENVIQALARIVITHHMTQVVDQCLDAHVLFQVHDEIVMMTAEDKVESVMAEVVRIMSSPPAWAEGLPVACEAGYADNYGDVERG